MRAKIKKKYFRNINHYRQ